MAAVYTGWLQWAIMRHAKQLVILDQSNNSRRSEKQKIVGIQICQPQVA